jgi:hypothetical protein
MPLRRSEAKSRRGNSVDLDRDVRDALDVVDDDRVPVSERRGDLLALT